MKLTVSPQMGLSLFLLVRNTGIDAVSHLFQFEDENTTPGLNRQYK